MNIGVGLQLDGVMCGGMDGRMSQQMNGGMGGGIDGEMYR